MGKRSSERPRLLVVTLGNEGAKWDILRQAPLLKEAGLSPRVFINPDLSVHEREKGKKLRAELTRRRASGETHLVIRRGRIVQTQDTGHTSDLEHRGPILSRPQQSARNEEEPSPQSHESAQQNQEAAVESATQQMKPPDESSVQVPDNYSTKMANEGETVNAPTAPNSGDCEPGNCGQDKDVPASRSDNCGQDQEELASQSAIQQSMPEEDVRQLSTTEQNSTLEGTNTA